MRRKSPEQSRCRNYGLPVRKERRATHSTAQNCCTRVCAKKSFRTQINDGGLLVGWLKNMTPVQRCKNFFFLKREISCKDDASRSDSELLKPRRKKRLLKRVNTFNTLARNSRYNDMTTSREPLFAPCYTPYTSDRDLLTLRQ